MNVCIGVIGGRSASDNNLLIAEEVGKEIAKAGGTLVCGGRGGIMEAACKGAKAEFGLTIGVLPGESRVGSNEFVDIPIVTGMGMEKGDKKWYRFSPFYYANLIRS